MCRQIERRHRRSPYQAPPLKRPRLVAVYSGPRPIAVETQIFAVVMREASRLKRLECSTRRQSSTRVREFREWKRTKASLLCSEHDAHLITGDVAMLTSMKLGLATTVAALSIAAVTLLAPLSIPHRPVKSSTNWQCGSNRGLRVPDSAGSPPTTMTTAISAIGVPARARGRALHQRAPLFRCRPKRGANVREDSWLWPYGSLRVRRLIATVSGGRLNGRPALQNSSKTQKQGLQRCLRVATRYCDGVF